MYGCRRRSPGHAWTLFLGAVVLTGLIGCTTTRPAPSPERPTPPVPALHGLTVMVLPVQGAWSPAEPRLDAELAFWLAEQAPGIRWIFPPALESALGRASALEVPIHALAVSVFRYAQVERIGDPLYGDLRRAGAIVGARYALVPVDGGYKRRDEREEGRVELAVAIIDTMGGAVLWYGVVAGEPGAPDDPAVIASAARALALTLGPRNL